MKVGADAHSAGVGSGESPSGINTKGWIPLRPGGLVLAAGAEVLALERLALEAKPVLEMLALAVSPSSRLELGSEEQPPTKSKATRMAQLIAGALATQRLLVETETGE